MLSKRAFFFLNLAASRKQRGHLETVGASKRAAPRWAFRSDQLPVR
jgi:hypothetical protein